MDTIRAWAGPLGLRRFPDDMMPPKRRKPSEDMPEEPDPDDGRDAPPPLPFEQN
jgi:hypothetical protein